VTEALNYLVQIGVAFDMMLNAILGGEAGQTLSYRAAVDAEARKPFWCLFCHFLSWWVQRDHCADQLTGIGMDDWQYLRAFVGLLILAALIALALHLAWIVAILALHHAIGGH
jgi:hypothetical protein